MPTGALEAVHSAGRSYNHVQKKLAQQKRSQALPKNLQLDSPWQVIMMLMVVRNVAAGRLPFIPKATRPHRRRGSRVR